MGGPVNTIDDVLYRRNRATGGYREQKRNREIYELRNLKQRPQQAFPDAPQNEECDTDK